MRRAPRFHQLDKHFSAGARNKKEIHARAIGAGRVAGNTGANRSGAEDLRRPSTFFTRISTCWMPSPNFCRNRAMAPEPEGSRVVKNIQTDTLGTRSRIPARPDREEHRREAANRRLGECARSCGLDGDPDCLFRQPEASGTKQRASSSSASHRSDDGAGEFAAAPEKFRGGGFACAAGPDRSGRGRAAAPR